MEDLKSYTAEELKAALAAKEKEEKDQKRAARAEYELERDKLVDELIAEAIDLEIKMASFKARCLEAFDEFRSRAQEYGDIRGHSKGGYSLRHSKTQDIVSLDRNIKPEYDERASMAEELIKEFLGDTVKKKDQQTYRTISTLMSKNKKGDYTPSRIASLLSIRDNYDDPRWTKAMELFEESFRVRDISYSVSFARKDGMGKDQPLCLSFSAIETPNKPQIEE